MTKYSVPKDWQDKLAKKLQTMSERIGECPSCGHQTSIVSDHIVTPSEWSPDGVTLVAKHQYPQAMLMCERCGHTTYYNLVILDILDKTPISEDTDG